MTKKVLAPIACVAALTLTAGMMTGCGTTKEVKMVNQAAYATIGDFEYGGSKLGTEETTYYLQLMDDETYTMTVTALTNMSGNVLGSTVYVNYGTYEKGEVTDGSEEVTLKAPTRVTYASQSTMGGYAMDYDTAVDTEYIIPGGDDSVVDKDTFLEGIGCDADQTVYIVQDTEGKATCQMTLDAE